MTTIPIKDVRENLDDLSNRVGEQGERLVVQNHGKAVFALVPVEDVALLERLEDHFDLEAIRAAKDEPNIPWEEVKKELGL